MNDLRKMEEKVIHSLRKLYHGYGYNQFKMSKFEAYDLYMQNKEFLVSDGVITFTDTDGTLMALKPDVTLSIVKNFRNDQTPIQKVCYSENVYRITGAGHTYREIMQTGLECLGDIGLYEISEVLFLAAESLKTISDRYVLDISHMGIISQLLSRLMLNDEDTASALRFLGEKNTDALTSLVGAGRAKDLLKLMRISGNIKTAIRDLAGLCDQTIMAELELLLKLLERRGLAECVHLDFSIISDRNYYNDYVFRGYVEGLPSAILAGGQYDRLMEKMNKQARGIGFAVYLDQLELLERRTCEYDIDTVLLYTDSDDILALSDAAYDLSEEGVLLAKQIPTRTTCRRLLRFENGRLIEIENNG